MNFLFILLFSGLSWADEVQSTAANEGTSVKASASYTQLSSEKYRGSLLGVSIGKAFTTQLTLGAEIMQLQRKYDGGAQINDDSYAALASYNFKNNRYIETQWTYSPDAEINPVHFISITPRQVIWPFDLGIGFDYRQYKNVNASSVHPNVIYDINEIFNVRAGIFIVRQSDTLTSGHGEVGCHLSEKQNLRFGGANGDTLEDAGLTAHFQSAFIGYDIKIQRFNFSFEAGRYWSDTRNEQSYVLKIEGK